MFTSWWRVIKKKREVITDDPRWIKKRKRGERMILGWFHFMLRQKLQKRRRDCGEMRRGFRIKDVCYIGGGGEIIHRYYYESKYKRVAAGSIRGLCRVAYRVGCGLSSLWDRRCPIIGIRNSGRLGWCGSLSPYRILCWQGYTVIGVGERWYLVVWWYKSPLPQSLSTTV